MKYSIRRQFAFIFIALMAGTILLCWLLNSTLLKTYYVSNKQHDMLTAYDSLVAASANGTILSDDESEDVTNEYDVELMKLCNRYNLDFVIVDSEANLMKSSSVEPQILLNQLWNHLFSKTDTNRDIQIQNSDYVLEYITDSRTHTEYIELWGMLEGGKLFLMRTPLESIQDSARLTNRLLGYVGIISLLVGSILIFFTTGRITRPIRELTVISKKMTDLDFEARYHGKEKNEIAILGNYINELSLKLETTISELKTANNDLKRDIDIKNEVNSRRQEFISNVSHELKTPIALIQGYAEGLREGVTDDAESKTFYCDVIADEAAKMNHMVQKLLVLNQLEAGQTEVTFQRINLTDLLINTIQSMDILLKQKEIKLEMEDKEPLYAWGDEFQVEEVIRNYLSNAINHCSGEKRIKIIIKRNILGENGDINAVISIYNTGIPIPGESVTRIWEKFYKVDKARTREYGGSGVGLSIVKAIMESMNKRYGVINHDDGVEFWFELAMK